MWRHGSKNGLLMIFRGPFNHGFYFFAIVTRGRFCYTFPMDKLPSLFEKIPGLWSAACEFQAELALDAFSDWALLYQRLDFLTESEWVESVEHVIPGWRKIATQNEGITARHTLVVLACCMNLPEYQGANAQTQREIEWAALFHDIDKDTRFGRDASHGVRSAAVAAQGLIRLGFEVHSEGEFDAWWDLLMSAQKQVDGRWVNDFSHLAEMITGLRKYFGANSSASRIIKAVMFHQSLPTVDDWPNPVILRDDQIRLALTSRDMDVLGPILLGDSDAWNVCEPTRMAYMDEIRGNIEKVWKILK